MKRVCINDLYDYRFLNGVSFSPDGRHAVFTVYAAVEKSNRYRAELWIVEAASGGCRRLTAGEDDRFVTWQDANTILFTSKRDKAPKEEATHYYTISLLGGEAQPSFTIADKVISLQPLPDGRFILQYTASCVEPDQGPGEVQVFDEIYFWSNGRGVRNKLRNRLAIYDSKTGERQDVTPASMDVQEFDLAPDGKHLLYTGFDYQDVFDKCSGLYLYGFASATTRTLVGQGIYAVSTPRFLDAETILFAASRTEFPNQNPDVYRIALPNGQMEWICSPDMELGSGVSTDVSYGSDSSVKARDGLLYLRYTSWSNARLACMDRSGKVHLAGWKSGGLVSFDVCGTTAIVAAQEESGLPELYQLNLETGEEKRLTHFHDAYIASHAISRPERFTFQNSAGVELEGFVLKPACFQPGRRYPGILEIHGGPKVAYGNVFFHEMQCLAGAGYYVFYTNPRGSDGRGDAFGNLTGELGRGDYADVMALTDEVLKRYPDLDAKRLGVTGGSYGGFMTNWIIGHTNRFAAAVSQRSISNYLTKSLTTDIGYYHNMAQVGGNPWNSFDQVWDRSPLKYAPMAKTPTLFLQSDEDYRCWMSESIQMFTALKQNGVDAKLVLFHKENHGLSRTGRPHNRVTRLTEMLNWMDRYLQ